jgi:small subunit ribosomal protein S6
VTRDYELMWILGEDADEAASTGSLEKVSSFVAENGGEVVSNDLWGRRTLSYEIEKNAEASYFLANFKLDSAKAPDLERTLDADQDVLRYLLLRHDKPVPAEPERDDSQDHRRSGRRDDGRRGQR